MGVGYPLLYKLFRHFTLIIVIVLVISGGAFYFLITLKCKEQCWTFFGIPIINLEMPISEQLAVTQISNVISAIGIFAAVLYFKSTIVEEIADLEKKVICPSQYSIMIQNLPSSLTQIELTDWVFKKFEETPVKVNIAYDVSELEETYQKKQELTITLNRTQIQINTLKQDQQSPTLKAKVDHIKKELSHLEYKLSYYRKTDLDSMKVGTAFVTFNKAQTVNRVLAKYETSIANSVVRNILSVIRTPPLRFRDKYLSAKSGMFWSFGHRLPKK